MTITDLERIDMVTQDDENGDLHLIVVDDLQWTDPDHRELLTQKLNNYAAFVQAGGHKDLETEKEIADVVIHLAHVHPMPQALEPLMKEIEETLGEANIGFAVSPVNLDDLPDADDVPADKDE